jgi:ABC-type branched-subunit amino acid transport system ATPase component
MTRTKAVGIGIGVAVALVAAAYATGRFQTASRLDAAESAAASAASQHAATLGSVRRTLETSLEIERARAERLEARRALDRALLALDERNFGTAQSELEAAQGILRGVKGGDPGLLELATEVSATRLVASEEVASQRTKLLGFVRRFDELVPPVRAKN